MALAFGTRLGSYEIVAPIGALRLRSGLAGPKTSVWSGR